MAFARELAEHPQMVSFKVDEVVAVEKRMPLASLKLEALLDAQVLAKSASLERCVAPLVLGPHGGMNGLLLAVHTAFGEHRALTLSPDDVWMAILQGFAIHVRENAEALRTRFVDFTGRATLSVATEDANDWPANVRGFERALAGALNSGLLNAMTGHFSTTSTDAHLAHCIATMDAFSRYFDYELAGICGIPVVTLTGTPEDWRSVRSRFRVLAEYDLQWWAERLEPVLDQFVRTAEGNADVPFWQSIYKPKSAYGGDTITGWLVRLFPYLESAGIYFRNKLAGSEWVHDPIQPSLIPRGLSAAQVRFRGGGEGRLITLNSGFYGVEQLGDCSLAPLIGWTASESDLARLIDALAKAHPLEPAVPGSSWTTGPATVPGLLQAFSSRVGGGSLYGGELVLLPPPPPRLEGGARFASQFVPLVVSKAGGEIVVIGNFGLHFATLRDGRRLVWGRERTYPGQRDFVLLLDREHATPPFKVVANSLLEFFQRLAVDPFPPWEIKGTWSPRP